VRFVGHFLDQFAHALGVGAQCGLIAHRMIGQEQLQMDRLAVLRENVLGTVGQGEEPVRGQIESSAAQQQSTEENQRDKGDSEQRQSDRSRKTRAH